MSWRKTFFSKVCSGQTNRGRAGAWFPDGLFLTFASATLIPPPSLDILSLQRSPVIGLRSSAKQLLQLEIPQPGAIRRSASIYSITGILHPIRDSREGVISPGPWLRYLATFNNTSLFFPLRLVIRLILVGRSSSSYEVDPQWARRFTAAWASVAVAGVFACLPRLYRSVKQGRAFTGVFGVTESWKAKPYVLAEERQLRGRGAPWKLGINIKRAWAVFSWTFPG